jgi:hypothetical protein
MFTLKETGERLNHRQAQNMLGISFPRDNPPPELEVYVPPEPTPPTKQDWRDNATVSAFQARAALKRAGYMVRVRGLMSQLDQDDETRMAWETAREFRRMSPAMLAMAAQMGLDDQALDSLFEAGSKIEA